MNIKIDNNSYVSRNTKIDSSHKHRFNTESTINNFNTTTINDCEDQTDKPYKIPLHNSDIFLKRKFNKLNSLRRQDIKITTNMDSKDSQSNIYITENSPSNKVTEKTQKNIEVNKLSNIRLSRKFEGIKEYIYKTKELILMKFQMKIKEEKINRITESKNNEMESIRSSIVCLETAKRSFEEDFQVKYENYQRHLSYQIHKENKIFDELLERKKELEAEVKVLEFHKNNSESKLEKNNNFKYYLTCVRNKKLNLLPRRKLFLTKKDEITGKIEKKSFFRFKTKKIDCDKILRNGGNSILGIITSKILKYNDSIIYDNPSGLIEDLNLLEYNNLNLLERLNDTYTFHNELLKENSNLGEVNLDNEHSKNLIIKKEKKLKKLKENFNNILIEKEKLLSSYKKNNTFLLYSIDSKFYNKLIHIYNECLFFYTCKFSNCHQPINLNDTYDLKSSVSLEIMRFIEKSFDYLLTKFYGFKEIYPVLLREFEKELDLERKRQQCVDQKIEIQIKTELLNKRILERINRVNLSQGKRHNYKPPSIMKKAKVKELIKKKDVSEIYDLIQF